MVDKLKVINFIQDFGCANLEQLQILFNDRNNNFKDILSSNMVSKKADIIVHNTRKIDNNMLIALDILCKYKKQGRLQKFYRNYEPVYISFLNSENLLYHIIVADEENRKGIVKLVNSYPLSIPVANKLILAFPDISDLQNIDCEILFLYTSYPELEILNDEDDTVEDITEDD